MLTPLLIVLPIFSLIFAGYLCRKTVMGSNTSGELNKFVVYLALPALLFKIVAHAAWQSLAQPALMATFSLGCSVIFFLTVLLRLKLGKRPLADASLEGLNAAYANTAFIGFPLCQAAFGGASQAPALIASIITVCLLFGMAIILIETGLQAKQPLSKRIVKVGISLAKNPLLIAPALGSIVMLTGLSIPQPVDTFLTLLGSAASPCALVALGLFIAEKRPAMQNDVKTVGFLISLKLLLQPILTWCFAEWFFHLNPVLTKTVVLLSALPTGTGPFMLAELYGRQASTISTAILLSTLLSLVTVPLLLWSMGGT